MENGEWRMEMGGHFGWADNVRAPVWGAPGPVTPETRQCFSPIRSDRKLQLFKLSIELLILLNCTCDNPTLVIA